MREIIKVVGDDSRPYHVKVTRSSQKDRAYEEVAVSFCMTMEEVERLINRLVELMSQFDPERDSENFACFTIAFDIKPGDGLGLFIDKIRRM